MRRAPLAMVVALALPVALASGACGTEEWEFWDRRSPDASLDAEAALDAPDGDVVAERDADGACDPDASRCPVSCAGGAPCPASAPVCTQPHAICQECQSNQDCDYVRSGPICTTSGTCVPECSANRPCPQSRPYCDRSIGRCVHCLNNDDCPVGDVCASHSCQAPTQNH